MAWIAAWLGVLATAFLLVNLRRGPTRIGGSPFLQYNAVFAALAVALPLVTDRNVAVPPLVFWAVLVLASWWIRSWSLVVGVDRVAVLDAVADCLARVRLAAERSPEGFKLGAGHGRGRGESSGRKGFVAISVHELYARCVLVRFRGRHPKLELAKRLLAKRFRGVVPRPRVTTR